MWFSSGRLAAVGVAALLISVTTSSGNVRASAPPGTSCSVFPADNVWNTDIFKLPVNAHSAAWLSSTGANSGRLLHPDFGGPPYGIPFNVVSSSHATANFNFLYWQESDPTVPTQQPQGPYPYGSDLVVEGPTDSHLLSINRDTCKLYEIFATDYNGPHTGGSGAIFDLNSNALRPDTWTSADAAGLPIFPGLVRLDEVQAGAINHAIRFTVQQSDTSHLWPARHDAGTASNPNLPPMGARFRLKSTFDTSGFNAQAQVVLAAMKHYGLIVADNGSNWFFQGTMDAGWNNEPYATMVAQLKTVPASAFEAVDESSLMVDPNSGQAAVHAPCAGLTVSSSPPSTTTTGTPVSITGSATGCPNPNPLYEFWVLYPGSQTWQPAQAYSSNATFSWTTTGKPAGTYNFSVWARDASSAGVYGNSLGRWDVYNASRYTLQPVACTSAGLTPPSSSVAAGTMVNFSATAGSSCPNPVFQYWLLPPGGSWVVKRPFSSNGAWSWDTTGQVPGAYRVVVWANQSGDSTSNFEAYAQSTITVTGCASVSVSASPGSPQPSGTPITLTASAGACASPTYQFFVLAPGSSTWVKVRAYSSNGVYNWVTTGAARGVYHFSVWVQDAKSGGAAGNSLGRWDAYSAPAYTLT